MSKKINLNVKNIIFLIFFIRIFFFQYFSNLNIKSLLNYKRNISYKFEISSSKNEGEYRFLVIFKSSEKIDPEKFAVHIFILEILYHK